MFMLGDFDYVNVLMPAETDKGVPRLVNVAVRLIVLISFKYQ